MGNGLIDSLPRNVVAEGTGAEKRAVLSAEC
jgi:hypothetical protein